MAKKMTLIPVILMIFTSVFGFTNMPRAFFLMGYGAIPWYVISGIAFFILYAIMMGEFGASFRSEKGGIYSWMDKSVGSKFAFVATFMWYASGVIWMVNVSSSIWIPLSNAIFGTDTTAKWSILGLSATQSLGILAALWILLVTFVITKGVQQVSWMAAIGGTAVALLNVVLLIGAIVVLIANHGHLAQHITSIHDFVRSPKASNQSTIGMLSFVVFAVFAYGGIEVVGGLVDKTEKPEKTMPKAIIISAIIMAVLYSVGIFLVGIFTNWQSVLNSPKVNLGNVAYIVMQNLGYQIGVGLHLSEAGSLLFGAWVARLVGLSMFLALCGAFVTLGYAPLKQLIEGTPAKLWPGKLSEIKDGLPKRALWVQCFIVLALILLLAFGGSGLSTFFNYLVLMTNVAMTLPYMFLAIAFIGFKRKTSIPKPFEVFKSVKSATIASVIVTLTVGFANIFTVIQPAITGDVQSTIWMIVGPVFFAVVALALYRRYEKRKEQDTVEKLAS